MTRVQEQTRSRPDRPRPAANEAAGDVTDPAAGNDEQDRWVSEGWLGRIWDDVGRTRYRLRRQLLPHAVGGAVGFTGLVAAELVAVDVASPGVLASSLAGIGIPAALLTARQVARRRKVWRTRTLLSGLAAAGWLTMVPFTGVGAEQAALLVSAEFLLAAGWWQANRIGYPDREPGGQPATPAAGDETVPAAEPDSRWPLLTADQARLAAQIIEDWQAHVACSDGPLPKSSLTDPIATRHGLMFTLHLARGKQTFTTVTGALEKIATGLDRPVRDLIFEPAANANSPAQCRFQYLAESPIAGDINFDGPRRDAGMLMLGPYADGNGEARWRLYTPGSMWGGVIIGGTGIGKSRVVENIVISALSGGDTLFWYVDPQRGASSPALADAADWFGTTDDAGDVLDAIEEILAARGEENAVEGWTGFTPSASRPGHLIVLEECHRVFEDPTHAKRWANIAREGRKVGIALLCISQYAGLVTFGGNEALRSSVMEGNTIVLRVTSNSAKGLMPGLQVNPLELPKIPGYAYCNADPASGMRTAPFRNRDTEPDAGPGADHWLAAQPMPALDVLSATATLAAGSAYHERHHAGQTTRSASRDRIEALRRGQTPTKPAKRRAASTSAPVGQMGAIIAFPPPLKLTSTADGPTSLDADTKCPLPASTCKSCSHRRVLDAVASGNHRPIQIENALGLKHRQVQNLLSDLLNAGLLIQPSYGRYTTAA